MPTISMFYGILVLMFFRDNRRHHLPHIHVRYQGDEAAISIEDGSMLDGSLPRNNSRWFKPGLKSTRKNFLSTGNLLSKAKIHSVLLRYSEACHVAGCDRSKNPL